MDFDFKNILGQFQKIQEEMEKIKSELSRKSVTAETGGGMVAVTIDGNQQILKISISDELIETKDRQMIEDLVRGAVNKAFVESQRMMKEEMSRFTSFLPNIPGLNLNI
ncbi:MAG: YbaB/EbfC family nucleoid-associated protein [Candidatus Kapabacteria bacterium]|nr:YbaB/EbfC family nucleoid-associated protein [Candidatus Kapabacteria bacterium]